MYAPVGSTVYNNYWNEFYTVKSHNDDGSITISWHGTRNSIPRYSTHRTDIDDRDHIVSSLSDYLVCAQRDSAYYLVTDKSGYGEIKYATDLDEISHNRLIYAIEQSKYDVFNILAVRSIPIDHPDSDKGFFRMVAEIATPTDSNYMSRAIYGQRSDNGEWCIFAN
jgi:hypothetical protein